MTTFAPPTRWRGTDLLAARPDSFRRVITGNLRPDAPGDLWEVLLSPALVDRTVETLQEILSTALAELTDRQSRLAELKQQSSQGSDAAARYRAAERTDSFWRPRALSYLHHIQGRCALVRAATGRSFVPPVIEPQADTSLAAAVAFLARAIAAHRDATTAEVDPEPPDTQLWALLDGAMIRHPDGHQEPLATWAEQWGTPATAS